MRKAKTIKPAVQAAPANDHPFAVRGDLAQWQDRIGRLCVGNSRLLFAVSAALAWPMLAWLPGAEFKGVHFHGPSSCGKTIALRVAASVLGGPPEVRRWSGAADAGVREMAGIELGGQNEASGTENVSWYCMTWLSAGEERLPPNEDTCAGIPADAGAGLGMFEALHGHVDGAALSRHLVQSCADVHGALGVAWKGFMDLWGGDVREGLLAEAEKLARAWVAGHTGHAADADGSTYRTARRFALVAASAELATSCRLTGWPDGAARDGVKACFLAWAADNAGESTTTTAKGA